MEILKTLKQSVLAVNKILKDRVETMGTIELLRNTHPTYRGDYARDLYKEKRITKEETLLFIKVY